jgi:hypothetical protein
MQASNIFANLSDREIDYVKARSNAKSNRQALRDANLSQGWLANRDADALFDRAMAFKVDVIYRAQEILDSVVEEAAQVKANGLRVRDEHIRQSAATEILDRRFGKPTQRQELTGKDGEKIVVRLVKDGD